MVKIEREFAKHFDLFSNFWHSIAAVAAARQNRWKTARQKHANAFGVI